jgi:hypothetical protein
VLFLCISTPLIFENSKYESVTFYFNRYNAKTTDSGISAKYPVDSISINLNNPFDYSDAQIKIKSDSFRPSIDMTNFSEVQINDYMNSTQPEYALKSAIFTNSVEFPDGMIYNNTVPIWAEISCVKPISIKVNPFFRRTSIDTWEGSLFFDTWNGSLNLNPILYNEGPLIKVTANKLIITTVIPDSYDIEPSDKLILEKIPDNYIITSELEPGESIDIKVAQKSFYEPIIIGVTFFCPLILGLILGPIVDKKLKERKSR